MSAKRIVVFASANTECMVPDSALNGGGLPPEVRSKKIGGCRIVPLFHGGTTAFEITLPHGTDEVHLLPTPINIGAAGSSVNIASMARALGSEAMGWFTLAGDTFGYSLEAALRQRGVEVHNLECPATPITVAITHKGEPTTLLMHKPPYEFSSAQLEAVAKAIQRFRPHAIFATSVGATELPLAFKVFSENQQALCVFGPRISILGDPQQQETLLKTMAFADVVVMNRRECRHMLGSFERDEDFNQDHLREVTNLLRPLTSGTPADKYFVVTCDVDGADAVWHNAGNINDIHHETAASCPEVQDTTGAGDAFMLGMAYGLLKDVPWKKAMQWGARLAAANIAGNGGSFAADSANSNRVTPAFFEPPTT